MSATALLFLLAFKSEASSEQGAWVVDNPAVFSELDARVRALPLPSPRTVASIAAQLRSVSPKPYDRARAAYVWSVAHIGYSVDKTRTVAQTLTDLSGDCEAHANLYAALGKALDLELATIPGSVRYATPPPPSLEEVSKPLGNGQWLVEHAWNAVKIDGKWGLVDTTLAVPAKPGALVDDYFCPSPRVLSTDRLSSDPKWAFMEKPVTAAELSRLPILRPHAARCGISLDQWISVPSSTPLGQKVTFSFVWRSGLKANLQINDAISSNRTLIQPSDSGVELLIAPAPANGIAWVCLEEQGKSVPLAGYPIPAVASRGELPVVMGRFGSSGARLVSPLQRKLAKGQAIEIRLMAPGAAQVVGFQGSALAGRFQKENDAWVFRGTLNQGTLDVMASYEDPRKFAGLLRYDVE